METPIWLSSTYFLFGPARPAPLVASQVHVQVPPLKLKRVIEPWDSNSLGGLNLSQVLVVPSDGVFTRRHTAECAFCTVFYSVFSFSTMLPWGGEGGRNNCFFECCFLPLSICTGFYTVFRSSALFLFFLHHLRFPLVFTVFSGFMTLLMLRCTLGWGGVGQSRSCEVDHVVEASSCC